jgi:hypothetical protein
MNDDLFITKPLNKNTFVKEGKPIVNITLVNKSDVTVYDVNYYSFNIMYNKSLLLANELTKQELYICTSHTPSVCYKPWEKEIESLLKTIPIKKTNLWDFSLHEKFRNNDSIALNGCFRPVYYVFKGSYRNENVKSSTIYLKESNNCNDYKIFDDKDTFLCINEVENKCKTFFNKEIFNKFD